MRLKPKHWFLISLLFFAAAYFLWQEGDRRAALQRAAFNAQKQAGQSNAAPTKPVSSSTTPGKSSKKRANLFLSNTPETVAQLWRDPHAIILRNALIDTKRRAYLDIPQHLRSAGAPGSYLVQSDRSLNAEFKAAVERDGGEIISYIPNNTALVRATPAAQKLMVADPVFQAVLPYEPYFKLDATLLPIAVDQGLLPNSELQVAALPGQDAALKKDLTDLGGQIIAEQPVAFGMTPSTAFIVTVPPDKLVAVAQLPEAQEIESYTLRVPMNDLTRVRLGISQDTIAVTNYAGLTGTNIAVVVNDTGADGTHPDMAGRLFGATNDFNGHGTHVTDIIIGNGSESSTLSANEPSGSVSGANFAGMAPQAMAYVQPLDLNSGPFISDAYLQSNGWYKLSQMAAANPLMPTNGYIFNNSWGYQSTAYDLPASSWDLAVRNAAPGISGEHAILPVFAAGDGNQAPGSITSPGTLKNGVTVGQIDSPRDITNTVDFTNQGITGDAIFEATTFDSNEVSITSSAGNVGVGIESANGRYLPQVVAPGSFTVSARAANYQDPVNQLLLQYAQQPNQVVAPGQTNVYSITILGGTTNLAIQLVPNELSPVPFPTNLQIYFDTNFPPLPSSLIPANQTNEAGIPIYNNPAAGIWFIGIVNPPTQPWPVNYDLRAYGLQTNAFGTYYTVLSNMNSTLKPYYRYESGTSMSAAAVSGLLTLAQQFLVGHIGVISNLNADPSPALMKALLINGSRPLNEQSDYNQAPAANLEGWGLPNITNVIPTSLTNGKPSLVFYDQSPTNVLQTGEWHTYTVNPTGVATNYPLRVSLVWTDPPGNPAAGNALVNDLDLVVVDSTGTNFFIGNDFQSGDIFTESTTATNLAASDTVNNVENVYLDATFGLLPPYTIYVKGTHVNVNAVTTQTNVIGQDYALVISSDDQNQTAALAVTDLGTNAPLPLALQMPPSLITPAQNDMVLLHQRVGANEPNLALYPGGQYPFPGYTNGSLAQWHFFVVPNANYQGTNTSFTNSMGANIATNYNDIFFTTFLPSTLTIPISSPVNGSFEAANNADIDLYVSTNPALLTLDSNVVAAASKSLNQGGDELVLMSNVLNIPTFYVGVKAETQQGADFAFFTALTTNFDNTNPDGSHTAQGYALPTAIPDSMDPTGLEGADVIAVIPTPMTVRKVELSLGIADPNPPDLYGTLIHNGATAVINHLTGNPGGITNVYDDLPEVANPTTVPSDGPAKLTAFVGAQGSGAWRLNEKDVAFTQSGTVTAMSVTVYPQPVNPLAFTIMLPPGGSYVGDIVVPDDATNLIIALGFGGGGPVGLYLTNQLTPIPSDYGTNITEPGGFLSLSTNVATNLLTDPTLPDAPPLGGGDWYYLITNGGSTEITISVLITIQESITPNLDLTEANTNATPLLTDGHTESQICIDSGLLTNGQQLVSLNVGLRIAKTNADNLTITLTSPQGNSILLYQDRGGPGVTNLGLTETNGSFVYLNFTDNSNLASQLIKFQPPPFGTSPGIADEFFSSFETVSPGDYGLANALFPTLGTTLEGWTVTTNQVAVVTNEDLYQAYQGTNYLALAAGTISNNFPTAIGQQYVLTYAARGPGLVDWWPFDDYTNVIDIIGGNNGIITNSPNGLTNITGEVGTALQFSGTNFNTNGTTIHFGTNVGNFGTNDFTVQCWINTSSQYPSEAFLENWPTCDADSPFWTIRIGGEVPAVPGVLSIQFGSGNSGQDSGVLYSSNAINDGTWHLITWTRQSSNYFDFIDGQLEGSVTEPTIANIMNNRGMTLGSSICDHGNNPSDGDITQPFNGAIDELAIFNRALSRPEIAAIYQAGTNHVGMATATSILPHAEILLSNNTNQVDTSPFVTNTELIVPASSTNWFANSMYFTAISTNTSIVLQGHPLGVLFDDFALQMPSSTNYVLPEESLQPFTGQNPSGCWTLDVWDTRSDSSQSNNGVLLGWNLQMTVSSTNVNLIVLTDHTPYAAGFVNPNSIEYFAFDVPPDAMFATNALTNCLTNGVPASLNLLFNQAALPTGTTLGDFLLLSNLLPTGSGSYVLTNDAPPPSLLPGARYYLGVQNTNAYPATFTIQVDTQTLAPPTPIVALANGVIYTTNIDPAVSPQYYSFVVTNTAVLASFQIIDPTSNLGLYVRHALPAPTTNVFDYEAAAQSTNNEAIVISTNFYIGTNQVGTNSSPIPLTPGTWYAAVYNFNTNSTTYQIEASYVLASAITVTPLTNLPSTNFTAPYPGTNGPGPDLTNFYSYTVTDPAATGVQFTLTGTGLDLIAQIGALPTPENLTDGSFDSTANLQSVTIFINNSLTSVVGTWYLGVPNNTANSASFTISAATLTSTPPGFTTPAIAVGNIAVANNQFNLTWSAASGAQYQVNVSTDLIHWTNVATISPSGPSGSYTDTNAVRQQAQRFYQVIRTQ